MKANEAFMLSIFRDSAYKETNPRLKLAALKFYRDKIDASPEHIFKHNELDADIKELEEQCQG